MHLSQRKREQLTAFLGGLPTAAALKLFAALEADRVAGGGKLPHDALLDDLRQQLLERGAILPARARNAKRLFFTPFEDLFIGKRINKKRSGRIARTSLDPIWRVMMTAPETAEVALAAASLDDAIKAEGATGPLVEALFKAAEEGVANFFAAIENDKARKSELAVALNGLSGVEDFKELNALLSGVEFFQRLQAFVPSAAPSLSEEQLAELQELFLSAYDYSPQIGTFLLLAIKGRLERPWRALSVYHHLARSTDERVRDASDAVAALLEGMIEDLESVALGLENDCAKPLDPKTAAMRVVYFADYADGMTRRANRVGDAAVVNRVDACREIAAEALNRFAEKAVTAIRRTTPVRKSAGSAKLASPRPDFAAALNTDVLEDGKGAGKLLARAPELADRLGADLSYAHDALEDGRDWVKTFANDLVFEIRAADGAERGAARRMLDTVLDVAEPLLESDEIGLIRDRGAAAAVAV